MSSSSSHIATSISALGVTKSSVRRRVSGQHTRSDGVTTPTAPDQMNKTSDPFSDVYRAISQHKLPPLRRELFSKDEDMTAQSFAHSLPPGSAEPLSNGYSSVDEQTETMTRSNNSNFTETLGNYCHPSDEHALGSLFELTCSRRLSGQCKLALGNNNTGGHAPGHESDLAFPALVVSHHGTNTADRTPARSLPLDPNTIRLVDAGKAEQIYDSEPPSIPTPRSPTLLATIHRATDRFTRRFPISVSHRKATVTGDPDEQRLLALLGYGETGAMAESPNAWTPEKWSLFLSVCSVFAYGFAGLLLVLMTWFGVWHQSIIMRITDYDILVTITSASLVVLGTAIFGICGTLLNSRPLLAMYCLLLWPSFAGMLIVGYSAYRRAAFALPNKLDQAWSRKWGDEDRMILQYSLRCCGYWSPEHEAAPSPVCYARAMLPGCKARLLHFERVSLRRYYTWIFSLVPLHVLNIVTAILCSNHVNRLFGKGLTPGKYRLSMEDVRANAQSVLNTYRETLIPPVPRRVYALRSRRLEDGTSRSPMIPQGGETDTWGDKIPHETSVGSLFGFEKAKTDEGR